MRPRKAIQLALLVVIISACTSVNSVVTPITPTTPNLIAPTLELNPTSTPTEMAVPATSVPTSSPTATQEATTTSTSSPAPSPEMATSNSLVIDHTSLEQFASIPEEYIEAASQLSLLFRHASVGFNISQGLDCIMNKTQPRPHYCDQGIPNDQILYNAKFDRNNWIFEFHQPPPEQNPGWYNKVGLFIERIDSLDPAESYDYAGFKLGYVDALPGSDIEDQFFNYPNNTYPTIQDLEDLELRHPQITFIYWTIALGRAIGSAESDSFNQQLRAYAIEHGKILMDIANIQSHTPDGTPCIDNAGQGHEAICDEYTEEINAGHLNALGSQRMAKAVWVLMARLAGWEVAP